MFKFSLNSILAAALCFSVAMPASAAPIMPATSLTQAPQSAPVVKIRDHQDSRDRWLLQQRRGFFRGESPPADYRGREFRRYRDRDFRRGDWDFRHRDRDYRRRDWVYHRGHRGYRDYRPGYRRYNGFWFPPAAFALGAIIGSQSRGTVVRPGYLSPAHLSWCHDRYRSYRERDNTFQPYNGPRRQCRSPYY